MRMLFSLIAIVAFVIQLHAGDQPLIPPKLNQLLPRINPGMKPDELEQLLAAEYPKVEYHLGVWSGQTGYMDFKLNENWTISVSGDTDARKGTVVHKDVLISIFDRANKHRVEIKRYSWKE